MRMRLIILVCLGAVTCFNVFASAQTTTTRAVTRPGASISVSVVTEEGQKMIKAVVTAGGKPVENASIVFGIRRTFGTLVIGEDQTLDDGSAAAKFPTDLPGDAEGNLHVVINIKEPQDLVGVSGHAVIPGGATPVASADPFPRALWAPHAPLPLVIPIILLVGGVWVTYAYVIKQVIAIARATK